MKPPLTDSFKYRKLPNTGHDFSGREYPVFKCFIIFCLGRDEILIITLTSLRVTKYVYQQYFLFRYIFGIYIARIRLINTVSRHT